MEQIMIPVWMVSEIIARHSLDERVRMMDFYIQRILEEEE
jgi:hypothetical protein